MKKLRIHRVTSSIWFSVVFHANAKKTYYHVEIGNLTQIYITTKGLIAQHQKHCISTKDKQEISKLRIYYICLLEVWLYNNHCNSLFHPIGIYRQSDLVLLSGQIGGVHVNSINFI